MQVCGDIFSGMTMKKLTTVKKLTYLFAFIYFASYVTRINFAAVIQEVVSQTQYEKSALSIVLVCLSISYGVGQIVNGWLGDRIKPQNLIACGLAVATAINFVFPLFSFSIPIMCALWTINGFAQAMMWPPIVKILVAELTEEEYGYSVIRVSCGSSIGTILVYLGSPLLISVWGWKSVFLVCAILGLGASIFWFTVKDKIVGNEEREKAEESETLAPAPFKFPKEALLPMAFIFMAIIFQGMLRDGVTTWMPTYLTEVFSMKNEASILCTVSLAVFTMVSYFVSGWVYKRFFKNEISCAVVLYCFSLAFAAALYFFFDAGAVVAIICMTMITAAIHGVNLMLITHVPKRFKKYGNISTISGVLNACTYLGSAIFTYGVAALVERFDWRFTVGVWCILVVLGMACAFVASKGWNKFIDKKD